MIVGTPSISTYVGGVSSIFRDKIDGYCYPCDEPELLTFYLKKMLNDDKTALFFSENSKKHAKEIYNTKRIKKNLVSIYNEIASKKE